jgi:hypothetical protein
MEHVTGCDHVGVGVEFAHPAGKVFSLNVFETNDRCPGNVFEQQRPLPAKPLHGRYGRTQATAQDVGAKSFTAIL